MFETGVQVRLSLERRDVHEVVMVNMSIDSEQTLEHGFDLVLEIGRKRHAFKS